MPAGVPRKNVVRIGLLGFGTVGEAFAELLAERRAAIEDVTGVRLDLVRIAVRDPAKPRHVCPGIAFTGDAIGVATAPDVDLVVELIGGCGPVKSLVLTALDAGKPVVTANKELVASAGPELFAAADAAGVDLFFEAAAVAAVPILRPIRESLVGEDVTRVVGIVNGTTNFMLTRMTNGDMTFEAALAEARRRGYAEPDPTADVEGTDAASKIAILASLAFNRSVAVGDVTREGILDLTPDDFTRAAQFGYVIKPLGVAERFGDGSMAAGVFPVLVARDHPLATVRDGFNAVFLSTGAAGDLMFYGRGAGPRPSASAVLGDVISAARQVGEGAARRVCVGAPAAIRPAGESTCPYLVCIEVDDGPGVLARAASTSARQQISIRKVDQRTAAPRAHVVFVTASAPERALDAALAGLRELPEVRGVRRLRIHE